jgi:membrane-bound ClpP family serine protease
MSAAKWLLVALAVFGIVLFLYGANYYDPVVGWAGVSFFAASVVGLLALYVYGELAKRNQGQKP